MKTTTYFKFPSEEVWIEAAQTLGIAKTVTVIVINKNKSDIAD